MPLRTTTNKTCMTALFKRMGFSNVAAKKLVDDDEFKFIEALRKCNNERCIDTTKALRHPGGTLVGELMSTIASNNFEVGGFQLHIWEHTHRFSKKVGNIVIDTDLFEHAERQVKLEKDYDKKLYIDAIEPIKESDTKNDFFNN